MKSNKKAENMSDEELMKYKEEIINHKIIPNAFQEAPQYYNFDPHAGDKMLIEMKLLNINIQLMTKELNNLVKGLV